MAGRCQIELGAPGKAEPLLRSGIATWNTREAALHLSWLAEPHARAGDFSAAREAPERGRYSSAMPPARTGTGRTRYGDCFPC